jgi:hypothetical protein
MEIEVEVVDAPLKYNLLLGCNWSYFMKSIVSLVFYSLCFPHEGNIMKIDQFMHSRIFGEYGPLLLIILSRKLRIFVSDMYSSLMGVFYFKTLVSHINAIYSDYSSSMRYFPFQLHISINLGPYLPRLCHMKVSSHIGIVMPLSSTEVVYQDILEAIVDPDPSSSLMEEVDPF